jgi:hypothetical protein
MNTTLTYIIFYTYFILSKDMKKKQKQKTNKQKLKMMSVMQMDYPSKSMLNRTRHYI